MSKDIYKLEPKPEDMNIKVDETTYARSIRETFYSKPDELLTDDELEVASAQPAYIAQLINQGIQNALKALHLKDTKACQQRVERIKKKIESQLGLDLLDDLSDWWQKLWK